MRDRRDTRPSIDQVHREADLGSLDVTVQMVMHGGSGVLIGLALAITGPTTPSFRVLDLLPGWPLLYGIIHVTISGALLFCRARGGTPRVGVVALALLALGYLAIGGAILHTWIGWALDGRPGSEPLLTAVPVCWLLALQTGYLAGLLVVRRRRGAGPVCGT